jgi:hypothetical protein
MFIFQLGNMDTVKQPPAKKEAAKPASAKPASGGSAFMAPKLSEEDKAISHAYVLLKEIVAKGDNATGSDRKFVADALEKVYGMAVSFSSWSPDDWR